MPQFKYYFFSLLYILGFGIVYTLILSSILHDNHILLLGLVATLLAVCGCSIINLFYFVPFKKSVYRYITPGLISVFLILFEFKNSIPDLLIFEFYAILNLILGIIWNKKYHSL